MKRTFLALLVASTLGSPFAAGPQPATEQVEVEWVGMHRDRLVELLGPPSKVKRTKTGSMLRYRFDEGWTTKWETESRGQEFVEFEGQVVHVGSTVVFRGASTQVGPGPAIRRIDFALDSAGKIVSYKVVPGRSRR